MSEQTNILESFILNKAPSNVPSIESKLLIQNLKSKIKQLERKIDGKHLGRSALGADGKPVFEHSDRVMMPKLIFETGA